MAVSAAAASQPMGHSRARSRTARSLRCHNRPVLDFSPDRLHVPNQESKVHHTNSDPLVQRLNTRRLCHSPNKLAKMVSWTYVQWDSRLLHPYWGNHGRHRVTAWKSVKPPWVDLWDSSRIEKEYKWLLKRGLHTVTTEYQVVVEGVSQLCWFY